VKKEMFNEAQKETFIKEYLRSKVVAETSLYAVFKKTEDFEEKLNKDVSKFTRDEILDMLAKFKAKSINSLLNYTIVLKHYSRFVFGEVGTNAYELIGKADIADMVDKDANILLTREELDDVEVQLLNWVDKAIIELLWNGVAGKNMEDIYSVSEDCVQGNILRVNEKEFPMTDRLRELLPKAFAETELMSYGNTMRVIEVNGKGKIYKERPNARGIDTPDSRFRWVYRKIQIFRDYLDIPGLTMKNIAASGLWHHLQLGMKETGLGLREFLKTNKGEELAKRYGFGDYWVDNIHQKYEQYV
jgi:hypothetical protein